MEDRPKYERLKQTIKNNIQDGIWKPGEKLPAENVLCDHFGVSKITVKKAKDELIDEGVLETMPGRKGVFVRVLHRISPTGLVGVAIDDIQMLPFADILKGIEDKLWEHKLHLTLSNVYADTAKVEAYFQSILQNDTVVGVIFAPVIVDNYLEQNRRILDLFRQRQVPYVFVDRYLPKWTASSVTSNNYEASKALTTLLLRQGHTRILALAGVACSSMNERVQGYLDAFEAAGIAHDPNLLLRLNEHVLSGDEPEAERDRAQMLAAKAGDFTACYPMNAGLHAITRALCPPEMLNQKSLALITYDEVTEPLLDLSRRVFFVRQPAYKMGWEAAKLLLDKIHEPDQRVVQITLKSEIVEKVVE